MEVKINIDSATLGGTVEEIFQSLSDEEKKEMAKEVMLKCLTTPMGAEREVYANKLAQQVYDAKKGDNFNRVNSLEDARSHYDFRQGMEKYKSSSDRMVEMITQAAIQHYKDQVTEMVRTDPQIQAILEATKKSFIENFPEVIQSTMAVYFASQMGGISQALMQTFNQGSAMKMMGANLQQQLANQGVHIQLPTN